MSNDAVTRLITADEIGRLMAEHATAIAHEHAVNDKFRAERDAAISERDRLRSTLAKIVKAGDTALSNHKGD
jgi:hypothetical protein